MNSLPKFNLAYLPTPIEPLKLLGEHLGKVNLLIKRDDMTGLAFGGNKTRKLEYLVADALSSRARTLVTTGAVQSNHCRQTAAAAAKAGLKCVLVLSGHPPPEASGNVLLDLLLGAEIVWGGDKNRDQVLEKTFAELQAAGAGPYLIPYGGSNAIGAAAYAFAVQELVSQGIFPDWIVLPTSSGGTQAGLAAGIHLLNLNTKVLGISVDEPADQIRNTVAGLAGEVCGALNAPQTFKPDQILVNEEFLGNGYGIAGPIEREAIELFARFEGILVDPVYTGRAAGGLIALVREGHFKETESVLFWHTGGTPAIFADCYQNLYRDAP